MALVRAFERDGVLSCSHAFFYAHPVSRRNPCDAYLTFGLKLLSPDNVVVQVLVFGLALLAGCGFLGGLYLILRVLALRLRDSHGVCYVQRNPIK